MTDHSDHSHPADHPHHDDSVHGSEGPALSLLRLSAFARLGWAVLCLVPLWAAVIWIIIS